MESVPLHPGRKSKFTCCSPQENDGLRVIFFCFGVLCICVTIALVISIYFGESEVSLSAAVATDSQQCSQVGVNILLQGGNAVDAAIASSVCMLVVNPHTTSLGGGGVMIIADHTRSKVPVTINFQNTAPSHLETSETIQGLTGSSSVGIPGLVSGLWEAHKKHGRSKWVDLFNPAIQLCQEGISVSPQLAAAVQNLASESPLRRSSLFFPNNIPLAEGQVIRQPQLAAVLSSIAQNGAKGFYQDPSGQNLIAFMKNNGVQWTKEDLTGYQTKVEPAISGVFDKMTVYTSSAPTSGPQLISLLNILEYYILTSSDPLDFTNIHELVEAMRLTQIQVSHLGDPLFSDQIKETVKNMINKTLAEQVGKQIHPDSLLPENTLIPSVPQSAASVVSVIDNEELYVSIVSGLNSLFGSQLVTPDGYLLNNAMANFYPSNSSVLLPENSNPKAGQRPLQFMLPVVAVETNNNRCGRRIVSGSSDAILLAQVIQDVIQFNQSVADSIRSPRIKTSPQSHLIELEDIPQIKLGDQLIEQLSKMGHTIKVQRSPYPSINVVQKISDSLTSQSDGRGGGYAVKYGP